MADGGKALRILREKLESLRLTLVESTRAFLSNGDLERAATISYYAFMALIPLFLLFVLLLSRTLSASDAAVRTVSGMAEQIFPLSKDIILGEVLALSASRAWGWLTMVLLFWLVTPLAASLRSAFYWIFKIEKRPMFLLGKLFDVVAVIAVLFMLLVYVVVELLVAASRRLLPASWAHAIDMTDLFLPFVLTVVLLVLLYTIFAPGRQRLAHLALVSLLATCLLNGIDPLFSLILRYNPDYGFTFGSLKAIFLLFVWVYYAFAAILFGAEVLSCLDRKDAVVFRDLFLGQGPRYRHLLNRFVTVYEQGQIVCREGEPGDGMFYVTEGAVALTCQGRPLRTLKPGEYFGEMAMLLDGARTATATASAPDTRIASIPRRSLRKLLANHPQIAELMLRELAGRLRDMDARSARDA